MEILQVLPPLEDPRVLVGKESIDDAGVVRLNDDTALVQTIDFITPVVDDPFDFGAIAAANSLSDVYAMGGQPLTALNVLANSGGPVTNAVLSRILLGGRATTDEAGVLVVGGHSVKSPELMFGLSVTGIVHPERIISNSGARPGDKLVLTKPIGVGILTTALKNDAVSAEGLEQAIRTMRTLNKAASEAMQEIGVHACTDVTGFGLLGHMWEMLHSSSAGARVFTSAIPHFPEAIDLAASGNVAGGLRANQKFLSSHLTISPEVREAFLPLLFDPQTSGGLLIAVEEPKAGTLLQRLREKGVEEAAVIGEVVATPASGITLLR